MIISIPAAIGMAVLADQILLMLFPTVPEGGSLLRIGSISIIFLALSQIVTGTLQGIGKVKIPAINAFWGAVTKVIFNYVLIIIPAINVKGAVISTIACYVVASLLNLFALKRITKMRLNLMDLLFKPLFASLAMGVVCFGAYKGIFMVISSNTLATIVAVLISMAVYFFVMIFIKGILKEDLYMLPAGGKIVRICEKFSLI